jgi:inositol oxygenase
MKHTKLRNYKINTPQYILYKDMHKYQDLEYVICKRKQYSELSNTIMNIKDVLNKMNDFNKYDKLRIYKKNCGLDKLNISFGHDEYLYQVLSQNKNQVLSDKYLNIIRYHSFYPWHSNNEYHHFMNENDKETLNNVLDFNQYDIYSKEDDDFILTDEIKKYYNDLLNTFFPNDLQW